MPLSNSEIIKYFDHRLVKRGSKYIYYPDLHKKYAQYTNKNGYDLILSFYRKVKVILDDFVERMETEGMNSKEMIAEGFRIYDQKPSQNVNQGITWSEEEYNHLGFQYIYIKIKSVQRFTEVYNLLVRMHNQGMFDFLERKSPSRNRELDQAGKKSFRIISIGGGPGFELYATRLFFEKYYSTVKLKLMTSDLGDWKFANQVFGNEFTFGSFYEPEYLKEISRNYDCAMMSYVFHHYFNRDNSKWELIHKFLRNDIKFFMVNSRRKHMNLYEYLEKYYYLYNLIGKNDHRQSVISVKKIRIDPKTHQIKIPFYDVPY